jgi:disulfide bond formation protein DsbB
MPFIDRLGTLSSGRTYWSVLALLAATLLVTALFFQHVLGELPCMMCIQVRIWVTVLLICAISGLLLRHNRLLNPVFQAAVMVCAAGISERSYMLLGTERGFVFSDCGFSLGLPDWLPLEAWFPALFQIETSCGYTPEIVFGITMAEALMVISMLLVSITLTVFIMTLSMLVRKPAAR